MIKLYCPKVKLKFIPLALLLVFIPTFCFPLDAYIHTPTAPTVYLQIETGLALANKYKGSSSSELGKYLNGGKPTNTGIIGVELGYEFYDSFRIALAAYQSLYKFERNYNETYEDGDVGRHNAKAKLRNRSLMLNGYYDFFVSKRIIPYITLGIGAAFNKSGDVNLITNSDDPRDQSIDYAKGKNKLNFIWALGAGIKAPIDDKWSIVLGYKYYNLGKFKTSSFYIDRRGEYFPSESAGTKSLHVNTITIGINYRF